MAIICGTDLSEASGEALTVARALAAQRGDREIVLVHVVEDEADATRARAGVQAQAEKAGAGPVIRAEVVVGPADATLVSFAETEGSDLIVIAASSRAAPGLRVGSTAEAVMVKTRVPVLVLRDPAPWLEFARGARPLRLLLGIDDSVTCELGIQWTLAMRKAGPIDVVLGAIYYPDEAAETYGMSVRNMVDADEDIEHLLARDLVRRFGGPADEAIARPRRGLGRIGDHLVELAREEHIDAIVIGTSQKTGLGRLGSVSSVVVHDAPQSVVCVPPDALIPTLRVPVVQSALVATDLSAFANRAVPFAFGLTPEGGKVHLLHIVRGDDEYSETEIDRALRALAPVGMSRDLSTHILRGDDAARTIAQTAARLGVDVICLASHGRSGISRALVGSVADKLLRATRKPVLVLRPTDS